MQTKRAPFACKASYDKDVEEVLAQRTVGRVREYLIHWKGHPRSEASWEPAKDLWQFEGVIQQFHTTGRDEGVAGSGGGECHSPAQEHTCIGALGVLEHGARCSGCSQNTPRCAGCSENTPSCSGCSENTPQVCWVF